MRKKILWITETAAMLALLITLQLVTKPLGQLVTGSCVNAILAVTALVSGLSGAVAVALISPVAAFLLNIAPQALTVPAIMAGNAVFVAALYYIAGKDSGNTVRMAAAWLAAAAAKFAVLHVTVVLLICGVLAEQLLASGAMKPPMLELLPAMFSWPQLITALIGGGIALLLTPLLRRALHR